MSFIGFLRPDYRCLIGIYDLNLRIFIEKVHHGYFFNQVSPQKNVRIYKLILALGPNLSVIECAAAQIVPNFMLKYRKHRSFCAKYRKYRSIFLIIGVL